MKMYEVHYTKGPEYRYIVLRANNTDEIYEFFKKKGLLIQLISTYLVPTLEEAQL